MKTPWVLSIDIGTSSVRSLVFDASGRAIPELQSHRSHSVTRDAGGGAVFDAEELLEKTCSVVSSVLEAAGSDAEGIACVATSCFWHSLVGTAMDGRAVTPVLTWEDARSESEVQALRRGFDETAVHLHTGCFFHTSYLPAKLLWLARKQPDSFGAAAHWMSAGEFVHYRLFGRRLCSHSMAAATGLYRQNEADWADELLDFLSVSREKMSPLANPGESLRGLKDPFAAMWPPIKKVPWYPAEGDGACSNIGCGCTAPNRAVVMVGTSGALRVMRAEEKVTVPPDLWCYRIGERRFLTGGALSNGGLLRDWLHETLALEKIEGLEDRLERMEPDGHGLTILPFLAGERSMEWRSGLKAAISGITIRTRPEEVLRAGLEAVAFRFAEIADAVRRVTPELRDFAASGGALLNSRAWMRILADVLECPVIASGEPEGSSRGAALLALESLGVLTGPEGPTAGFGEEFAPVSENSAVYRRARRRHEAFYRLLVGSPTGEPDADPKLNHPPAPNGRDIKDY